MEFSKVNRKIKDQFAKMCATGKLFRAEIPGSELWSLYLKSFKEEKTFRDPQSSEHNCNCCNNFIRRYGNVVSITDDGELESMFSNISNAGEYEVPLKAMDKLIKTRRIKSVFFESFYDLHHKLPYETCKKNQDTYKLGVGQNLKRYNQEEVEKFGVVKVNTTYTFDHFCIDLPKEFVNFTRDSLETIIGKFNDNYSVFKRAVEDIPVDTLNLVKDLINQGSLLDGTAHLKALMDFTAAKKLIDGRKDWDLSLACWDMSYHLPMSVTRFKNNLIGVLCSELAEGMELNKACENWNKRVDPVNYHKATAPITQNQIKEAQKFVEENGYEESFKRRFAIIDDIKVSEIKHINSGDGSVKTASIFDGIKSSSSTRHKRSQFDKVDEITIDKFMQDILPGCTSVEVFLENRMEGNLMALTTSQDEKAKRIFKWDNPYSWTFKGNLAGKSQIKEAVKATGGKADGDLRFSLGWAEGEKSDNSDLDAHCYSPEGHIMYSQYAFPNKTPSGGNLGLDITNPGSQRNWKNVVENITWPDKSKMKDGIYRMQVHCYRDSGNTYFEAEIAFDGEVYNYRRDQKLPNGKSVDVAKVTLKKGKFTIEHIMPETQLVRNLWGLETDQFHKVNLLCLSPNHWGDNEIGNKHYMFGLEKCLPDSSIRSFHNENLLPDLLKHKKVMEVLGASSMLEPDGKKLLSGLGFNSTVRDEVIVKCSGNFKRMLKIKF